MRELLTIIKEHKIILVALISVMIVFVLWSVLQIASHHSGSAKDKEISNKNESISSTTSQAIEAAKSKLSDRQKRIISNYTDQEKEIVAFLKNNVWITENQTGSIEFSDYIYTEMVGSDTESHPYAITAIANDQIIGDGASYVGNSFALETDNKTFIIKRWQWIVNDKSASEWKLTSDGFSKGAEYIRTTASTNFEVLGLNEDVCSLYGNREKLITSIHGFVSQAYPTATIVTWREDVSIDYKNKLVTTSFTLNTKTSSVITVKHNNSTGEITIE